MMIEFLNPTGRMVVLTGPNKETIQLSKFERRRLPPYYKKYVPRYLRVIKEYPNEQPPPNQVHLKRPSGKNNMKKQQFEKNNVQTAQLRLKRVQEKNKKRDYLASARNIAKAVHGGGRGPIIKPKKKIVGRANMRTNQATEHYVNIIKKLGFPISNDIGVGILSYNRLDCITRLVDSIRKHTDLTRTTIIISDESSDDSVKDYLSKIKDMAILQNDRRIGIAGNTNRLFQCLNRFNYRIILNDDVEVKTAGWENFYANAMATCGIHHFCMRQEGVYGAKSTDSSIKTIKGLKVRTIMEKPQGAILAFDKKAFDTVGYMDESFGLYGMEHVDWSNRVSMSGVQMPGFHDIQGSHHFFRVHASRSAVQDRSACLGQARKKYAAKKNNKSRIYVKNTEKSKVEGVTYIVPFRGKERSNAIKVVLLNIKGQKFPFIDIIMVEQDRDSFVKMSNFRSITHLVSMSRSDDQPFCKSMAFNLGAMNASTTKLILHDADMLVQNDYTTIMFNHLHNHPGVHVGKNVLYLSRPSCDLLYRTARLEKKYIAERSVGYFEGGSLGCRLGTYFEIGGFNERFVGYGCFCPGNHVLTMQGYKPIEDVVKEDLLYTHEAEFRQIELRERIYEGKVLDLFIPGRLPIKGVTPEHPFLVQVDEKWEWKMAGDLCKGDRILDTDFIPELLPSYDFGEIGRFDKSANTFCLTDHMDDFCYLLGLYIAEGVLQTPDRLRIIYLFLDKEEKFLAEHIEEVVHRINDEINVAYHYVKNNCREVRIFNSLLSKYIHAIAGKRFARNKILSTKFLNSLEDRQIEYLLGGLCDGDANHSKGSKNRIIYHTSSFNMAMIASGLMRKLGIAHSFGKRNGGSFDGSAEWAYDLCVNREFEHRLRMKYPKKPLIGSSAMGRSQFGLVYDVKERQYSGPVYNFEVNGDHSYIVNGLVCHNCEDTEFFARLSSAPGFLNERSLNLLHLWHGRTPGWDEHHKRNKKIEKKIYAMAMRDRIADQHRRFEDKYRT